MENVIAQHITKTPGVCGGRACIAGHRIRVQDIVVLHEMHGMSPKEILEQTYEWLKANIPSRIPPEIREKFGDLIRSGFISISRCGLPWQVGFNSGTEHAGIAWCPLEKYRVGGLLQALLLMHGALDRDYMRNHIEYL